MAATGAAGVAAVAVAAELLVKNFGRGTWSGEGEFKKAAPAYRRGAAAAGGAAALIFCFLPFFAG